MAYTGVDMTSKGGARLTCIGVSELVRDRIAIFVEAFEKSIEVLSPEQTELIEDHSSRFIKTYLEALLRSAPKTDAAKLYIYIYIATCYHGCIALSVLPRVAGT